VPNGEFVGQIPLEVQDVSLDIPGVPAEATSFGSLVSTIADFFGGLFGGSGPQINVQTPAERDARIKAFREGAAREEAFGIPRPASQINVLTGQPIPSIISGRVPIPLPEQGGPEFVTETFRNLPPLPDVPDLVQGPVGFEGVEAMPVDAPLLASLLPAVRGAVQPSLQGIIGGLTGGFLQEFLRPIQETGLGTVPMRQAVPQAQVAGCPPEKPHTRILRFIRQNTGVKINLSRAKSLIRELGLENAARCLGIGAGEVCSLLIVASPRRRRGISASDIRIVRRTARRFENLKHDLGHLGGRPGPHHHRRRTKAHAHK